MASDQTGKLNVFISYSRQNLAKADALVRALEERGFSVMLDRRDLPYGEKWQFELAEFIRTSDTVIWLISRDSVQSKWCNWEIDEVHRRNKRLVPVRLDDVRTDELPRQLGEIHILPAEGVFELDRHLDILVQTLETDRAWVKEHSRLAEHAHQWTTHSRAPDLLLRGAALRDAERWHVNKPPRAPEPSPHVLDLILNSRRRATRTQRLALVGSVAVAAAAIVLAGFALTQRNAAQTAERKGRETLALSDFTTATTEPASRALGRLARAIRVDPDKASIGRRALYLLAEHPYLVPLPQDAAAVPDGWVRPIMHYMQHADRAPDGNDTVQSPATEHQWSLATGAAGTPCETRLCVITTQPPQDPIAVQTDPLWSKPRVTFPAHGRFAVMAHGICIEFGGTSELVAFEDVGITGFRLKLENEIVHELALSPDGQLLFVEMSNCGATIVGFEERRRVQVYRILGPNKPPIALHTIFGGFGELAVHESLPQVRIDRQRFLMARVMLEERVASDNLAELRNDHPIFKDFERGSGRERERRSHNGALLARAERDGHTITVRLTDARSGSQVLPNIVVQREDATMFFAPDDSWFGVAGIDGGMGGGLLNLIDLQTGLELRTSKGHVAPYAVRKDGRRILAGGSSDSSGTLSERPVFIDIVGDSTSTPIWVADLAEAIGGWRLDARAVFEPLTGEQRLERLARVRSAVMGKPAGGNRWLEFAQWYLGDTADGRVSPYASVGGKAGTRNP